MHLPRPGDGGEYVDYGRVSLGSVSVIVVVVVIVVIVVVIVIVVVVIVVVDIIHCRSSSPIFNQSFAGFSRVVRHRIGEKSRRRCLAADADGGAVYIVWRLRESSSRGHRSAAALFVRFGFHGERKKIELRLSFTNRVCGVAQRRAEWRCGVSRKDETVGCGVESWR